jgi:hypothetical protein
MLAIDSFHFKLTNSKHRRIKSVKLLSVVRSICPNGRLAGRRFFADFVDIVRGIPFESKFYLLKLFY